MTEPDYSPGQTAENGRPICGGRKRDGGVCGASPRRGATRCKRHGGDSPQAKAKAAKRVTDEKAGKALRNLGYEAEAENIDPAEALLRLVSDKYREVAWWRSRVDALNGTGTDDELTWGRTKHEEGVGPLGPVDKDDYAAELNVNIRALHTAEDQLARYASAALKAGVEQRQLEIREAEALVFVGALHSVFNALSLTDDQRKIIPEVVPNIMRQLEARSA